MIHPPIFIYSIYCCASGPWSHFDWLFLPSILMGSLAKCVQVHCKKCCRFTMCLPVFILLDFVTFFLEQKFWMVCFLFNSFQTCDRLPLQLIHCLSVICWNECWFSQKDQKWGLSLQLFYTNFSLIQVRGCALKPSVVFWASLMLLKGVYLLWWFFTLHFNPYNI